ncbi:MAG TPA: prolipoprotein diacylglyceryl transferase [Gemmatimonadaceae bacterium]|nr:prolipoprotein diacylglyceryl transferase [Gemmatimonadaceae bacterium]
MTVTISFDPVIAQLGPIELGWHGVFTVLAIAVGIWWGLRGARRIHVSDDRLGSVLTWAVAGGFVGARLFHVADHVSYYAERPLEVVAIWQGGIAVWGAFAGAIAAGLITARHKQLPIGHLLDIAGPAMLIGQAIGRLGCLANGDAWGAPTDGGWGIVYTNPNDRIPRQLLGVATHPYPTYEIAAVLMLLGILAFVRRRLMLRPGDVFLVAALGYAAIRFSLSYVRQETIVFAGLQEAQVIALGVVVFVLASWLRGPLRPLQAR